MIKAIIFGMSGVIYDSTPYNREAIEIYLLKKYNIKRIKDRTDESIGMSYRDKIKQLNRIHNIKIDFNDFSKKTRKIALALMKDVKPNPGVKKLLSELKKHKIKKAIASMNQRQFILEDLKAMGLENEFDIIISVEDLTEHKPKPNVLLLAAKKLEVKPEECVNIDDAKIGAIAAKNAGMKSVILSTKFSPKNASEISDLFIKSMNDLTIEKLREL